MLLLNWFSNNCWQACPRHFGARPRARNVTSASFDFASTSHQPPASIVDCPWTGSPYRHGVTLSGQSRRVADAPSKQVGSLNAGDPLSLYRNDSDRPPAANRERRPCVGSTTCSLFAMQARLTSPDDTSSSRQSSPAILANPAPPQHGRIDGPRRGLLGDNAAMESFFQPAREERHGPPPLGHPRAIAHRHRHLDRTHLPPTPTAGHSRTVDPHRIRSNHDHTGPSGRVTETVTSSCSRPLISGSPDPSVDLTVQEAEAD